MNWTAILSAVGIPDSPGRIQALLTPPPEPLPADLTIGEPCCVWFLGPHDQPSGWRTGFRIEALTPGGAIVGDKHRDKASEWVSLPLPRCRIHPGHTPPPDDGFA
jgi:hypothetical protein